MSNPNPSGHAGRFATTLASVSARCLRIALAAGLLLVAACGAVRAQSGPPSAVTIGETRTAVVLVNFQDATTQPATAAQATSLVFGSVSDFLWENSYHHTFLSGDTFGWFTLPLSAGSCDTNAIVGAADKAVTATGASLSGYAQVIYMFPTAACGWAGLGGVSASGQKQVFINGASAFALRVIAHEIGHGYQLDHSDALECGASTLGNACSQLDQASPDDTMGSRAGHYNVFQKERLGWLNASGMPALQTVTSSGRYAIEPLETQTLGTKGLKIAKGIDATSGQPTWYYLEYRQPVGFDAILAGVGTLTRGVSVIEGMPSQTGSRNVMLDMTPESNTLGRLTDFEDGVLAPGQRFTDAASGVSIAVVSADASGAVVDVTVPAAPAACTRSAPVLSLSGGGTAVAAGTAVAYTVRVLNQDSSSCDATTFALARSVPSSWSGALGTTTLALSPGASGSTTLTVASPSTATAGTYGVGVATSSSAGSVHGASAGATYAVMASGSGITEALGTDKTSYRRGDTVAMSALLKRDGVAVAGASVKFSVMLPGGGSSVLVASTGTDGIARASYRTAKNKSASGSYRVQADATVAAASASATAGFNVL